MKRKKEVGEGGFIIGNEVLSFDLFFFCHQSSIEQEKGRTEEKVNTSKEEKEYEVDGQQIYTKRSRKEKQGKEIKLENTAARQSCRKTNTIELQNFRLDKKDIFFYT